MNRSILPFLCFGFLFFTTQINAQYKSAIGARLGYPFSASYKMFISDPGAIELTLGTRGFTSYRWISVSAAYQHHQDLDLGIDGLEGLRYYFGGGASLFLWSYDVLDLGASTSFGLQGYLGLDYRIPDTRINISLDWVPTFRLNGYLSGFGADYGSLGVRYILSGGDED